MNGKHPWVMGNHWLGKVKYKSIVFCFGLRYNDSADAEFTLAGAIVSLLVQRIIPKPWLEKQMSASQPLVFLRTWYNDSAGAEFTLAGAIVPLLAQRIIPKQKERGMAYE